MEIIAQQPGGTFLIRTGPDEGFIFDASLGQRYATFALGSLARGPWEDVKITAAEQEKLLEIAKYLAAPVMAHISPAALRS